MTCVDGYQPSIPVREFTQNKAFLAISRTDQKEFTLVNTLQSNEKVSLGPTYLVWDNLNNPQLLAEGPVLLALSGGEHRLDPFQ